MGARSPVPVLPGCEATSKLMFVFLCFLDSWQISVGVLGRPRQIVSIRRSAARVCDSDRFGPRRCSFAAGVVTHGNRPLPRVAAAATNTISPALRLENV